MPVPPNSALLPAQEHPPTLPGKHATSAIGILTARQLALPPPGSVGPLLAWHWWKGLPAGGEDALWCLHDRDTGGMLVPPVISLTGSGPHSPLKLL